MQINISKFLHTATGKYLMSIVLGLGLASLFRTSCKGINCNVIKAPPLEEIESHVYMYNGECFKIKPENIKCDDKRETLK